MKVQLFAHSWIDLKHHQEFIDEMINMGQLNLDEELILSAEEARVYLVFFFVSSSANMNFIPEIKFRHVLMETLADSKIVNLPHFKHYLTLEQKLEKI